MCKCIYHCIEVCIEVYLLAAAPQHRRAAAEGHGRFRHAAGVFTIVLDRGRITSTVAVLTSFLAFSLLLDELIFSADCDLHVAHTKVNLVH